MTKPKEPKNSKKPNDSTGKEKRSALSNLIKNITEKVVAANKPNNAPKAAKVAKSEPAKAAKAKPEVKVDDPKKGNKPSTLSAAGSASASVPVTPAAIPAPGAAVNLATVAVENDDTEIYLTDAEGRRYCRAMDCDQVGMVDGYCRYHYLYFWKKIQVRKKILADGKLERYIEELTSRYVDKFIELLRKDTRTEKDFLAAVHELELDDSTSGSQQDDDEAKSYIEEISGVATDSSGRDEEGY